MRCFTICVPVHAFFLIGLMLIMLLSNVNSVSLGGRSLRSLARSAANHTMNRNWPNLRFMRTFFRTPESEKSPAKSMMKMPNIPVKLYMPNPTISPFTEVANMDSSAKSNGLSESLFDWTKIRPRWPEVSVFRSTSNSYASNQSELLDKPELIEQNLSERDGKKEEDEKESSGGLSNYLSSWFSGNSPANSNVPEIDELQEQKLNPSVLVDSSADQMPLYYHSDKWFQSGPIQAMVCDKTMALVRVNEMGREAISDCELFDLDKRKKEAEDLLKKLHLKSEEIKFEQMMNVIEMCKRLSEQMIGINSSSDSAISNQTPTALPLSPSSSSSLQENNNDNKTSMNLFNGIVPGTFWCGLGDSAKSYNDLGPKQDIDICCRAHDHCPVRLKSFRPGYGLFNFSFYTKSHCKCDNDFFQCLRKINNRVSNMIGNFFFNVLKVQCIDEEPTCVKYNVTNGKNECIQSKPMMQIKLPEYKF